jgi:hypothetical protein
MPDNASRSNETIGPALCFLVVCSSLASNVGDNVAEYVADRGAQHIEDDDHNYGDQHENQPVLDQALTPLPSMPQHQATSFLFGFWSQYFHL